MTTCTTKPALQKYGQASQDTVYRPTTDIYSNENEFVITLDLPGVLEKDVEVKVEHQSLTVKAAAAPLVTDESYQVLHSEWTPGRYERAFSLPQEVDRDGIAAELKHGVLRLVLPKSQATKARRIEIKS